MLHQTTLDLKRDCEQNVLTIQNIYLNHKYVGRFNISASPLGFGRVYRDISHQHLTDFLPLVPLQLHNLSILWVLHNSSIAGKLLLGHFHNLLEVVFSRETPQMKFEVCYCIEGRVEPLNISWCSMVNILVLDPYLNSSQCLPSIPLLNPVDNGS